MTDSYKVCPFLKEEEEEEAMHLPLNRARVFPT